MNRKYLGILFSNIGNRMRSWERGVASHDWFGWKDWEAEAWLSWPFVIVCSVCWLRRMAQVVVGRVSDLDVAS